MPTPLDPKTKLPRYQALHASLVSDRSSFDAHWRDLADFMMPRRTRFFVQDRNRGEKRNQNIIDSTGRFAARTLQSGLHAGLTSPARPWMSLSTPDPELAAFAPVKEWLHIVTQRMLAVFASSNLYQALPIVYGDMGLFATGAMGVLEDSDDLMRCFTYPIGSYAIGVNSRGNVSTFAREYEITVRQVVETFGVVDGYRDIDWSHISTKVKEDWERGNYERAVDICWMVLPNAYHDPKMLGSKFLPFASCHWEKSSDAKPNDPFLRESGFHNFPIMVPRWDVTSHEDSYGTDCPGMTALGDVRQLQIMQKRKAQAINKMVDPALVGPNALRTQKTSLLPGDVTYLDVREGQQGLKSIHDVNLNIEHLLRDMGETQYRIQRAFYEDLFLMLATRDQASDSTQPVTAREIAERHEEKLLALGPVLERANDELLEPLVDRAYSMMERAGLIPEPPEEVKGVNLKVEFISVLAQAQKSVGVAAQDRFLQSVGALVELFPAVRHKVNVNQVVDNYRDMLGVDPRLVRPNDEADQLAADEAKAQQGMADAAQAKDMATAAKAAGTTPMDGDTALTRIVKGSQTMQQQQGAA